MNQILLLTILFLGSIVFAMEYEEARHLLNRTGFGATPSEIDQILPLSYEEAVGLIINNMNSSPQTPSPDWVDESSVSRKNLKNLARFMSKEQAEAYRKKIRRKGREQGMELKAWWFQEMIQTKSPLTEKMTLFWHNHFTSSLKKVKSPLLIYRQNSLFRQHAKGSFRTLVHLIAKDPAMIFYLDNQTNRKSKPNENFARELLELFTLGEGNYTEKDIKEAARAFTGWMSNRQKGDFVFNQQQHDFGTKNFMGREGDFGGEEIIDIVLENPQVSRYICRKLWREFISDDPEESEVDKFAQVFRESNYEIAPVLRTILLSQAFRSKKNRGVQIKSPTELIVGTIRLFNIEITQYRQLIQYSRQLGQDLFDPPNVKGWPGGKTWITSTTLLARQQLLQRSLRGMDMFLERFWILDYLKEGPEMLENPQHKEALHRWIELSPGERLAKLHLVLLPTPPVNEMSLEMNDEIAQAIGEIILDPAYQLK